MVSHPVSRIIRFRGYPYNRFLKRKSKRILQRTVSHGRSVSKNYIVLDKEGSELYFFSQINGFDSVRHYSDILEH